MKLTTLIKTGIGAAAAVALALPIAADPVAANARDIAVANAISHVEQATGTTVDIRTANAEADPPGGSGNPAATQPPGESGNPAATQEPSASGDAVITLHTDRRTPGDAPEQRMRAEVDAFNNSGQSLTEHVRQLVEGHPVEGFSMPDLHDIDARLDYDGTDLDLVIPADQVDVNASWWVTAVLTGAAFVASIATKVACYVVFAAEGPIAEAMCSFIGGFTVNFFINFFIMAADGTLGDWPKWQGVLAQSLVVGLFSAIPGEWIKTISAWLQNLRTPVAQAANGASHFSGAAGDAIRRVGTELENIFNDDFVGEVERELERIAHPGQAAAAA